MFGSENNFLGVCAIFSRKQNDYPTIGRHVTKNCGSWTHPHCAESPYCFPWARVSCGSVIAVATSRVCARCSQQTSSAYNNEALLFACNHSESQTLHKASLTSLLVLRTGSIRLGSSWKGEKKKAYCNYPQKASGHHRCHWLEINSRLIDLMIDSSIKTKKQKINSVNKIGKRKKNEKKYKPNTTSSLIKRRWSRFWWIQLPWRERHHARLKAAS